METQLEAELKGVKFRVSTVKESHFGRMALDREPLNKPLQRAINSAVQSHETVQIQSLQGSDHGSM